MRKSVSGLALVAPVFAALLAAPAAAAAPQPQSAPSSTTAPTSTDAARIAALEARVQALEARLQQVLATQAAPTAPVAVDEFEALAAEPSTGVATGVDVSPQAAPSSSVASGSNAFNPAISIILDGRMARHSRDRDADGFSLGESEISFAANVDDKFFGQLTLAVESEDGEDHIGIEEAYLDTTALTGGWAVRVGRFFSNIGYLNTHHAHTDSFSDRPLAYAAFLGEQYGDDGVQVRWVAPTPFFLEMGGEVLRGAPDAAGNVRRKGLDSRTVFAHAGGSVGEQNEWLAGVSMLDTSDTTLYIADGTWKWAPHGNFKDAGVVIRGEYLRDDDRSGAYLEAVYRFDRTWDIGYRRDRLWPDAGVPFATSLDQVRDTAQVTWRNSEFSLLRLQFSRSRPDIGKPDNAITVQYQASLGAHGAHKF